ncbi:MAG TPA: cobalamin-binding protein [Burkholderiaceae bacterium]|nr:cobalamin-binding protein [Burkholderiaceae bacterium]
MDLRRRLMRAAAACAAALALGSAAAQVRVLDVDGRPVQLAAPARRVVSLAPHLTELMFAIGAGDRVVGTVEYADFPAAARRVPRVGDSSLLDLERIVALQPDLVLVWRHGNSPQQLQRLASLRLPTYASEARTLADIARTMRDLGALTGSAAQAEQRARAFDAAVSDLRARYAGRRRLTVFYQIWDQPLITVNGEHLISQVLGLCGADNVFAGQKLLTPTVTAEAVLRADPDAIVAGWSDSYGPAPLDRWRRLGALRAVRQGHLLQVDPDLLHRQSDRVVLGARELCEKLDAARDAH